MDNKCVYRRIYFSIICSNKVKSLKRIVLFGTKVIEELTTEFVRDMECITERPKGASIEYHYENEFIKMRAYMVINMEYCGEGVS